MNWELAIALVAAFSSIIAIKVAVSSKRQAKASSDESLKIQKRMEINQFYPIIDITPSLEDGKIMLVIKNRSDQNKASEYLIKYSLRITAKNITIDASGESKEGELKPNETVEIFPQVVNEYFSDALPFINRTADDNTSIRIRFWVQYKAAHPESQPMSETTLFRIEKENSKLKLVEEHL